MVVPELIAESATCVVFDNLAMIPLSLESRSAKRLEFGKIMLPLVFMELTVAFLLEIVAVSQLGVYTRGLILYT